MLNIPVTWILCNKESSIKYCLWRFRLYMFFLGDAKPFHLEPFPRMLVRHSPGWHDMFFKNWGSQTKTTHFPVGMGGVTPIPNQSSIMFVPHHGDYRSLENFKGLGWGWGLWKSMFAFFVHVCPPFWDDSHVRFLYVQKGLESTFLLLDCVIWPRSSVRDLFFTVFLKKNTHPNQDPPTPPQTCCFFFGGGVVSSWNLPNDRKALAFLCRLASTTWLNGD